MSEITYTVLDLSLPISEPTFREVFGGKRLSSPSNVSVRLSEQQFRAFAKVLFAYGMHYGEVSEEKREVFLNSILENSGNLTLLSQTFCEYLMNNLDESAIKYFNELQTVEYNLNDPLSNEALLDFVEMELVDPTVSYRKWEYGRFVLDKISKDYFEVFDRKKIDSKAEIGKIGIEDYLEELEKNLDKSGIKLDTHEKAVLQLVVKQKVLPKSMSLPEYLLIGDIVQSNLLGLTLRREKLENALEHALTYQRNINKNRGGPKL